MKLTIVIENQSRDLELPETILEEGESFFQKMDNDMNKGWQMGPDYIESPNQVQRCQIAADKILTAIDTENENLLYLMAGYIVSRIPEVKSIDINTTGELSDTLINT
ncbi:MAG: hypothetical protein R3188_00650 [Acidiferrobacterales bacterium]|jgi:hypothetical protein|nr:hypothetical protein [Acidiferrobacterales bacterium]